MEWEMVTDSDNEETNYLWPFLLKLRQCFPNRGTLSKNPSHISKM